MFDIRCYAWSFTGSNPVDINWFGSHTGKDLKSILSTLTLPFFKHLIFFQLWGMHCTTFLKRQLWNSYVGVESQRDLFLCEMKVKILVLFVYFKNLLWLLNTAHEIWFKYFYGDFSINESQLDILLAVTSIASSDIKNYYKNK